MNMWTAIVLIVLITAFTRVMIARHSALRDSMRDKAGPPPATASRQPDPELQREVEVLRKRLEVLERITTDDRQSRSIASEIESLRDK